ncbi:MAG: DUF1588 domain-containing protein [Myxococcales bacterium]|nr:DUF1588 domain-containing protein [Myxococcales bacterium]MCB9570031.1 DUF1588 domain-containing protein [Myxococcales bacterium]MCB9701861.1 DUF1588 domain-containing protein [Myxococcales bacterium]
MSLSHPLLGAALILASIVDGGCYVGVDNDSAGQGFTAGLTQGASAGSSSDSAGSDSAGSDSAGSDSAGDDPPPELAPAPASIRLLLNRHYRNAIRDLLGEGAAAVVNPPLDTPINGFDAIGASQLALSDASVEAYENSARAAAAVAIQDLGRIGALMECQPQGPGDSECHANFIRNFGRLAWRRPLTDDEVGRYVAVAQTAALDNGDFYVGVENAIATLLQSPNFLYMVEIGEADPEDQGRRYLTSHEMATRLSFFLNDTTPPPWLLDGADDGLLDSPGGVRDAARVLLDEPAARVALDNYFAELLRLRSLDTLAKDSGVWPQWSPALAQAMRTETLMLIQDVVWQRDADFLEILDAPYTFANNLIGPLYGLTPPGGGLWGDAFVKTPLPAESKRGGILGQGALLSVLAHISSTSPTLRGKFVRETLLCEAIPAPPPGVNMVIPPEGEALPTMRERLQAHLTDPGCAACHVAMDPIGFGLENFDGLGVFRTMENGAQINTASDLNGAAFDGARELGAVVREQENVPLCIIRNLFRHSTGHVETTGELPTLMLLDDVFAEHDHSLQDLLVELVSSPTFRMVGVPE